MRRIINRLKKLINKISRSNEEFRFEGNFSVSLMDSVFDFDKISIKEVNAFCKKHGYKINRVFIISFCHTSLEMSDNNKILFESGSNLRICKVGKEYIAYLILDRVLVSE